MKYLYYIFRLFFCPHRYEEFGAIKHSRVDYDEVRRQKGTTIILQCKKCGKMKSYKFGKHL